MWTVAVKCVQCRLTSQGCHDKSRRGDEAMLSHPPRQQPGQRGQHRPIRPRQIRSADLTAQDRYLVTENEQLGGLRRVASGAARQRV